MACQHVGHDHDTDCDPTCRSCGEVTPCPEQHTCGRTPQGTAPAHQPHKAEPTTNGWTKDEMYAALLAIHRAICEPLKLPTKDDFTLAAPRQ